jgi:UDP-glucose 4-epimerase
MAPEYGPPRPGDVLHITLARDLARERLGWEPAVSLEEGLTATVEWFHRHPG